VNAGDLRCDERVVQLAHGELDVSDAQRLRCNSLRRSHLFSFRLRSHQMSTKRIAQSRLFYKACSL
jgi:hypothetical protein